MLIHALIDFCDSAYMRYGGNCGCGTCNRSGGQCSGSCYDCLYEIHYPVSTSKKKTYDCQKLMYHYVCQYSYRYASEILYALNAHSSFLSDYKKFHLMSIACGACPDLMALEAFCINNSIDIPIAYRGYDINPLWNPIHGVLRRYCDENNIRRSLFEKDVLTHFKKYSVRGTNIIVIGYLLSYLYNTNQTDEIDLLFNNIADHIVLNRDSGDKVLIILNDVNSNRRGRDYFSHLPHILRKRGLSVKCVTRYFDSPSLNYFQRQGAAYPQNDCLFTVDEEFATRYHVDAACRSFQLVVEVS